MNEKEFRAGVMEELHSIHSLLLKMSNADYCQKALLLAIAEQPSIRLEKLEEDYEENLMLLLAQVPPDLQHPETYEKYREALQRIPRSHQKP